jgi:hypothetical protein
MPVLAWELQRAPVLALALLQRAPTWELLPVLLRTPVWYLRYVSLWFALRCQSL